jgi:hydroxyethylthiazole kinase-like uncharacterized protein yjeF
MIQAWSASEVRAGEEPLLAAGVPLMDRAAFAVATQIVWDLRTRRGRIVGARVILLVGSGNNGGDALYAGVHLRRRGVAVTALILADRPHPAGATALKAAGGHLVPVSAADIAWARTETLAADVVVDAILGIGARGALQGVAGELVSQLTQARARTRARAGAGLRPRRQMPWVVAVDVPSGIGVDDGTVPGPVLPADRTVTFGGARPGLLLPPAAHLAGEVTVADIGLSFGVDATVRRLAAADVGAAWPVPGPGDHKYTRGVVGVVAGTPTYPGAAVLTTSGAVRAGVGMVRYLGAVPHPVLAARPEVVTAPGRVQSWVVGPGLSGDDEAGQHDLVRSVLRSALGKVPVVVDAGALALLPAWVPPTVILTPHAGELATLLVARGEVVDRAEVEAAPVRWARRAHQLTGATILLKGSTTVVVGGDAAPVVYAQADGPAWLATAGAGDVLAGVLGAMLAGAAAGGALSEPSDPARVAAAAALIHGRAGALAGPGPVVALDVARAVSSAVQESLAAAGR